MVDTAEVTMPPHLEEAIAPAAYHDPTVFAREVERIFRRCWLFVGFTDDLTRDGDYITAELAGTSVMVRNVGGQLRALHNVCSHRFAKIHDKPCGNGRLTCPYHGWTYDADGVPVGIPGNETFFGYDRAQRERLALKRFEVAARGRFVFVRLQPGGPSLDQHLGAYGPILDHASEMFPDRFDDRTMPWATNWKIGVESVLEVYHVASVHPETFKPFFKPIWEVSDSDEHSRGIATLSETGERYWSGLVKHLGLKRTDRHRDYDNLVIFPNLAIGVTHGAMMSVHTYDPVAPERCNLRFHLFLSDADKRGGPVRRHVEESLKDINLRVLDEDRIVCESVQGGIRQAPRPAVPGANEARIHAFHRAYRARMTGDL